MSNPKLVLSPGQARGPFDSCDHRLHEDWRFQHCSCQQALRFAAEGPATKSLEFPSSFSVLFAGTTLFSWNAFVGTPTKTRSAFNWDAIQRSKVLQA